MRVVPLRGFDHHGLRTKGTGFDVSESTAKELVAKGLVKISDESSDEGDDSEVTTAAKTEDAPKNAESKAPDDSADATEQDSSKPAPKAK